MSVKYIYMTKRETIRNDIDMNGWSMFLKRKKNLLLYVFENPASILSMQTVELHLQSAVSLIGIERSQVMKFIRNRKDRADALV